MMQFYENWWEEKRSAYLYECMAKYEKNLVYRKLFLDLQAAAQKQAGLWEKKLPNGENLFSHPFTPDFRTRFVCILIKYLGTSHIQFILSTMKIRGMSVFARHHTEHKHTSMSASNNIRAAVFGINDGLVSNLSLILGISGASTNPHFVILAGVAGLLAGACSMGAGEYISVQTQREVLEHQIEIEKHELEFYPEEEKEELSVIYQARGLSAEHARLFADILINNPDTALNTLAREELGLNPDELVSPLSAMLFSFFSFAFGAAIPLLPFLFSTSTWNLTISIASTSFTLFVTGALLSLYTNRHPLWLGLRMTTLGLIAGGITFFIGKIIGIGVG
jgi:VIT1/CCC1 family predicted Fe2+/Mn2+ transporter